jgi:hypothetical protein
LNAILSGLIAQKLGAKKSAMLVTILLLNLGHYAHTSGFSSYSTSHNITNLFGLLAIWLMIDWVNRQKFYNLFLLLIVLVAGAVSDPWMIPAYNLPILLIAILCIMGPALFFTRQQSLMMIFCSTLSIVAVKTKLFTLFYFLPDMYFKPGDWRTINENTIFLIKDLGGLLNLVPHEKQIDFLPSLLAVILVIALLGFLLVHIVHSHQIILKKNIFLFLAISFFLLAASLLHL